MVYSMLMEASASPDPAQFTQSDLYRRCVAAGVVPATEAELISGNTETTAPMVQHLPAAEPETLPMRLTVSGMWCPACAWVIETALNRLDGVAHAACDYASDRLNCRYDPKATDPGAIHHAVQRLGYTLSENGDDAARSTVRKEFIRLMVCLFSRQTS
jgi:copper chaperone CopZ